MRSDSAEEVSATVQLQQDEARAQERQERGERDQRYQATELAMRWTTLMKSDNVAVIPHTDAHNLQNSMNVATRLTSPSDSK